MAEPDPYEDVWEHVPKWACRADAGGIGQLSAKYRKRLTTTPHLFEMDRLTLERWGGAANGGMSWLRACDALALYHHLDPDRLGLTGPAGYFEELRHQLRGDKDHIVTRFVAELDQMAVDIDEERLHVYSLDRKAPAECAVPMLWFFPYIWGRPQLVRPSRLPDAELFADPQAGPPPWPCRHFTPEMLQAIQLQALFKTPAEGGTYLPWDQDTIPDIYAEAQLLGVPKTSSLRLAILLGGRRKPGRPASEAKAKRGQFKR